MLPEDVVKRPIVLSEKADRLRADNQYLFKVDRDATKTQIRRSIETLFRVSVVNVNTMIVRGRMRRMGRGYAKTKNWKKAIVTLAQGHSIDFFEGA